jgi:hypothetical protein
LFNFQVLGALSAGYIGQGIGLVLDSTFLIVRSMNQTEAEDDIADGKTLDYEFDTELLKRVAELDKAANWQIYELEEYDFGFVRKGVAKRLFRTTDANFVLFIQPTYFFSPDLGQLRLIVVTDLFKRSEENGAIFHVTDRRRYEFLSQSRGDLLRSWQPGEKEAMASEIETIFANSVEEFPDREKKLIKKRDRALKRLKKRDEIVPVLAIAEGWPGESLVMELHRATDSVINMIHEDLRDIDSDFEKGEKVVRFTGLNDRGKPAKFKGYKLETAGRNTIYHSKGGDFYSVPDKK